MQPAAQHDLTFVQNELAIRAARHGVQLVVSKFATLALEILRDAHSVADRKCNRLSPEHAELARVREHQRLTPAATLNEKLPTTDGRTLILSRYTHPEPDHKLLLEQLNLTLPGQPPPRISSRGKLLNQY